MAAHPLRAPFTVARYGQRKALPRPSISVAISQKNSIALAFDVKVYAHTKVGVFLVGSVQTAPLATGQEPARGVLLASCPGAFGWTVRAEPKVKTAAVGGWLIVDTAHDLGCCEVVPLNGSTLLTGGPLAGAYNHAAGTAAGAVSIPAGGKVRGWSLQATAGGAATLIITSPIFGALPTITVPTSSSFGDTPDGLTGPATFTYAGAVAARWTSWLQLGGKVS